MNYIHCKITDLITNESNVKKLEKIDYNGFLKPIIATNNVINECLDAILQ